LESLLSREGGKRQQHRYRYVFCLCCKFFRPYLYLGCSNRSCAAHGGGWRERGGEIGRYTYGVMFIFYSTGRRKKKAKQAGVTD